MRSSCSRIGATAAAASGELTVMRTSSEPAAASWRIWMAVAIASAVSVLVIDWTTTSPAPPIRTERAPQRTCACRARRRGSEPTGIGAEGQPWAGSVSGLAASFMAEPS
jgi:hypothetical protein